jgi:hypothetical protein
LQCGRNVLGVAQVNNGTYTKCTFTTETGSGTSELGQITGAWS